MVTAQLVSETTRGGPDQRDEARWLRPKPARCPPRTQAAAKPRGLTGAMEAAWLHILANYGVDKSTSEQLVVQVRRHLEAKEESTGEAGHEATAVRNDRARDGPDAAATREGRAGPSVPRLPGDPLSSTKTRAVRKEPEALRERPSKQERTAHRSKGGEAT